MFDHELKKLLEEMESRLMTALDDAVAANATAIENAIAAGIGTSGADDSAAVTALNEQTANLVAATPTDAVPGTVPDTPVVVSPDAPPVKDPNGPG